MWLVGALAALALAACGGGGDTADVHWPAATATGPTVTVPRLAGLDPDVALHKVKRLGLRWHASFPGSAGNPAIQSGCSEVYNQAPAAGTQVQGGYTISVTMAVCHRTIPQGQKLAHLRGTGQSAGRYPAPTDGQAAGSR
jgi:beta-lactam-binding protein with PASTA domain